MLRSQDEPPWSSGYPIEKGRGDYPRFTFRHHAGWAHNNILLTRPSARSVTPAEAARMLREEFA
jgi:hypothetical protein